MILSAVDIGSNASRLLIVEILKKSSGEYYNKKINFLRIPTQLGIEVFNHENISSDKINYLLNTLSIFKQLSDLYNSKSINIVATSALREANNGQEVIRVVKSKLDLDIILINGSREAELVAKSYRMINHNILEQKCYVFVDVGGGSTDIAVTIGKKIVESMSFSVGAIKISGSGYSQKEWLRLEHYLYYLCSNYVNIDIIASGGNARKLLKLFGVHSDRTLSISNLLTADKILQKLTTKEIVKNYNVKRDRAVVIGGATVIFKTVATILKAKKITIPKIGLADGVIYETAIKELD